MSTVTVYKVKRYDITRDEWIISSRMATRLGAVAMRGEVIEDTAIDIDVSQLEPGEQWKPPDFVR